jgi:hypothetical protein
MTHHRKTFREVLAGVSPQNALALEEGPLGELVGKGISERV